ncbi:MAG: GNAT family N-acetyltransferase [Candidatus Eisenbacteria bacterium]
MTLLTAAGLELEPLSVAHADAMFEVLADPELYRYMDNAPPPSVEHLRGLYERQVVGKSPDGSETWLNWVIRRPGHPPMGYVQATVSSAHQAWVAYVLGRRHWGEGHAHAAMDAMLKHLSAARGVVRFLATVEVDNLRSIRLLERLGFRLADAREAGGHHLTETERLYIR